MFSSFAEQIGYSTRKNKKVQEDKEPPGCYYNPHHAVIKEDRLSTKVRLVFDGSSKEGEERSLNDVLYKGPALQPKLSSIVIRFRKHNVGINADVKKMYLMITVAEDDRDKLRFFWEDSDAQQAGIYRNAVYRSTVLPFGLRCSPFLAIATVHHHLEKYEGSHPSIVKQLMENMYIDDALTGVESEEEAIQFYEESYSIMKGCRNTGVNDYVNLKRVLLLVHVPIQTLMMMLASL